MLPASSSRASGIRSRGRSRRQWGDLTDDDLDRTQGQWDQVVGKIKERTGQTAEEIEAQLNELSDSSF